MGVADSCTGSAVGFFRPRKCCPHLCGDLLLVMLMTDSV